MDGTGAEAGDIAPTGRRVAVDYIHVLRYRDGQHISFSLLFDRLQMLEQLGLIPAPAPRRLSPVSVGETRHTMGACVPGFTASPGGGRFAPRWLRAWRPRRRGRR